VVDVGKEHDVMVTKKEQRKRTESGTDAVQRRKGRAEATDVRLGKAIQAARLDRGMTRRELGQHLRVTSQQIQKYEEGTNRITVTRLLQLARFLDVPVGEFLDDALEPTDVAVQASEAGTWMRALSAIDDAEARRKLLDIARMLATPKDSANSATTRARGDAAARLVPARQKKK
jgi:transcriptional regulator with XRE-family HTH domain